MWRPYELNAFEIQEIVPTHVAIWFWSLVDVVKAITLVSIEVEKKPTKYGENVESGGGVRSLV